MSASFGSTPRQNGHCLGHMVEQRCILCGAWSTTLGTKHKQGMCFDASRRCFGAQCRVESARDKRPGRHPRAHAHTALVHQPWLRGRMTGGGLPQRTIASSLAHPLSARRRACAPRPCPEHARRADPVAAVVGAGRRHIVRAGSWGGRVERVGHVP